MNLDYQPCDQVLGDLFMYEDENDVGDFLANLDAIAANFQTLRRSYPLVSQHIRDQGLIYVKLPSRGQIDLRRTLRGRTLRGRTLYKIP
jgi:hypothetical protein